MNGLENALRPMRRRMKLQRTVEWGAIGLLMGMVCVLLVRAASFLWPISRPLLMGGAALAGLPLLCGLVSQLWPVSAMDAARQVDKSGLQARAQTALMLLDSDTPMARLQRTDTLQKLNAVRPKEVFPLRVHRFAWIGVAACVALFGASYLIPNPQDSVLKARAAFQEKMEEQAKLVDEGAVRLDAENEQTPELRKVLGDLSMELRRSKEAKEALGAVDKAERRIENMRQTSGKNALDALSKSGQDALSQALKAGDEEAAKRLLSELDKQEAASALEGAANLSASAAAKEALNAAAQAMLDGKTLEALEQLMQAASGANAVTVQAAALGNMARLAVAGAGAQGQGALGLGKGQGGSAGAGAGSSDKDGGYHQSQGRVSVTGKENKELKVKDYEPIYDPTRLNREGETVTAKGQTGEGETLEATAGTGLGTVDDSVPYNRVLSEYTQAEVTAAQNANLPAYARQWVTDYFNALAQ